MRSMYFFLQREATDKQGPQSDEKNGFMTIFLSQSSKMERDFSEIKELHLKTVNTMHYWIFISDLPYQATVILV